MRKIDWRHPASLWLHWEVWQYHRSIDKWKGYKLRKRYEVTKKETKKVRSYKKSTKLRKRYEVTNMIRSYEKCTKMLRNKLRNALVMKLPSYEIVTPPIGIIYYEYSDALWGNTSGDVGVKWPSFTGSHLWRMKYLRYSKKNLLLNFKPVTRIWKNRSADKKLKNNKKKKKLSPKLSTSNGINVEIR